MDDCTALQVCLGSSEPSPKCEAASWGGKAAPSLALPTERLRAHSSPGREATKANLVSDPQNSPSPLLDSDWNNNQLVSESKGGVKFLNHLILPISSATMALKNYGHLSTGSGSKSGFS